MVHPALSQTIHALHNAVSAVDIMWPGSRWEVIH